MAVLAAELRVSDDLEISRPNGVLSDDEQFHLSYTKLRRFSLRALPHRLDGLPITDGMTIEFVDPGAHVRHLDDLIPGGRRCELDYIQLTKSRGQVGL